MLILHVIDHLGPGGAQTVLAEMVNAWPDTNDELHVVGLGSRAEMTPRFASRPNVTIDILGGGKWDVSVLRTVRQKLRSGQFDVVHAHLTKSIAGVLWAGGNRHAVSCGHLHGNPRLDSLLLTVAVRRWNRRVDRFVSCCDAIAEAAFRRFGVPRTQLVTIPNAVRNRAECAVSAVGQQRAGLTLPGDCLVVGFVGRLSQEKGLLDLLRAMSIAGRSSPQLHLVIVGDGPQRTMLERRAKRLGLADTVHFAGFSDDVAAWMNMFDIGVLPSHHEGLPLVLLEIQQMTVPVVATRVGGIPEVVVDRQTGLLVPPSDPEALAGALVSLASNTALRDRLAVAGRDRVRDLFSIERQVALLRSLYEALLADRQAGRPANASTS